MLKNVSKRQAFLVFAQLLTLCAFALGLAFLTLTSGGTLFLFSAVAPVLVVLAVAVVAVVAFNAFRQRHSLFEVIQFEQGDFVFRQGDAGDCAYFIQSGEVEVLREIEGEGTKQLATLKEGQFFGESSLLSKDPRNATIRATCPTQLAVLGMDNFQNLVKTIPSARQAIMAAFQERATIKHHQQVGSH